MSIRLAFVALSLVIVSIIVIAGCETNSRARQLVEQNKCRDCHTIKGKGGASAPNLTTVGSRRSREYIYQQIKDPESHNPNTAMPSFGDRLSEQDLDSLADYFAGLK
jgi:cytochrome c553